MFIKNTGVPAYRKHLSLPSSREIFYSQVEPEYKVAPIKALTAAALVLPGLLPVASQAVEDDSVDFQYSHYQEGKRDQGDILYTLYEYPSNKELKLKLPSYRNPIEVDSVHGSARVTLNDRIKFAFNYLQDTWSGATPLSTVPEHSLKTR